MRTTRADDAINLGGQLATRFLDTAVEGALTVPGGVMGLLVLLLQLKEAFGVAVDPLEKLGAALRADEVIEVGRLLGALGVAQPERVHLHHVTADHLHQGHDAGRIGDDYAVLNAKLTLVRWELESRKNGM